MPTTTLPSDQTNHAERLTPKSSLRHRPIAPQTSAQPTARVPRASRTQTQTRSMPKKTQTITGTPIPNAQPDDVPMWKHTRSHAALWQPRLLLPGVGIGMLLAILVVVLGQLLIGWIGNTWNTFQYGYPRTYQVDAVVGHHDSVAHPSHFIALNIQGQIEIIEFPGGDASHAKIYLGPHAYGSQADLVPVTLRFVDTQHNHQPDMVIQFQGEQIMFHNADGTFHPPSAPA